ncbi:MAG: hypothetical protein AABX88_01010 [Nanoarchaeota archaeon]
MVYKKYIKRGNKVHGPYYYESYRDDRGITRKKYLGTTKPGNGFNLLLLVGIVLLTKKKSPHFNVGLN